MEIYCVHWQVCEWSLIFFTWGYTFRIFCWERDIVLSRRTSTHVLHCFWNWCELTSTCPSQFCHWRKRGKFTRKKEDMSGMNLAVTRSLYWFQSCDRRLLTCGIDYIIVLTPHYTSSTEGRPLPTPPHTHTSLNSAYRLFHFVDLAIARKPLLLDHIARTMYVQ